MVPIPLSVRLHLPSEVPPADAHMCVGPREVACPSNVATTESVRTCIDRFTGFFDISITAAFLFGSSTSKAIVRFVFLKTLGFSSTFVIMVSREVVRRVRSG